ncbi:sigma-70 family RNA polymerase sigma factor [Mesorhizobium sp. ES1-3]|uniref:sigma-70 family RNA polymerase sigma factor n=1 Tax=Mesorhizobium sp. ES1-3 TaxID=2876628 RepID=UPI001CCD7E71|nr:sigma-70 family RNA polymerase sigma factor [Mesorhizobium sp. ES1-3]MBZ9672831.1 sigma-70 family RNA polymerase sigma factor [Mesorhizobium sp. ES1-3]
MRAKFDVTPYLEDLWRYGRVLTRDDADADDLVQEALARALSLAGTYDASRPLLPWLIRIVRNTFLTGAAHANADKRRLESYAETSDTALLPSQEHSAELSNVRKALVGLPTEQAEVLHLVGVLGFTYSEAAELLGVPTGTVMSRLSRARAALKRNMEKMSGFAPAQFKVVGGRDVAK